MTDPLPGELSADPRDALIREQAQVIATQAEKIAGLEAMVAGLREQLEAADCAGSRNSGNSSMPPSSDDLPGRKPRGSSGALLSGRRKSEGSSRAARGHP